MIQRNHKRSMADVRAQVLAHIETSRRASVAEIHTLTGWAFRQNTIAFLRAMATDGLLVSCRAKVDTPRAETYYFLTMAERDEWHAKGMELVKAKRREYNRLKGLRRTEKRQEQVAARAAARKLASDAKAVEKAMQREAKAAQREAARQAAKEARAARLLAEAEQRNAQRAAALPRVKREKLVKHVAKAAKKSGGARAVEMGLRLDRDRERDMKRAEEKRRAERMRAEPVITAATKITRAAPLPDRWGVEATMLPCFSAMPPGYYMFEPKSCAARAA